MLTEAEYVVLSKVTTKIMGITKILEFLDVPVKYPIDVYADNVGAIGLAQNATSGSQTKHVDTRYHYVREKIDNGKVKISFVRSEDNTADLMTKNLNREGYQ